MEFPFFWDYSSGVYQRSSACPVQFVYDSAAHFTGAADSHGFLLDIVLLMCIIHICIIHYSEIIEER